MQERRHPSAKMSVCMLDDLILAVGRRAPGGEVIGWLERQVLSMPTSERAVYLQVVLPTPDASPEVAESSRRAMVHFGQACQSRLQGAAFALLLDGFLGATVRSVLAAALMAARPSIPVKMFGSVSEASTWLGRTTGASMPPAEQLTAHVARLAGDMGLTLP